MRARHADRSCRTISTRSTDFIASSAGATACRSCRRPPRASTRMLRRYAGARPRRNRRARRAGVRRGDGRAHRDQRGDGGLRSGISAGADRGGRSDRRDPSSICRAYRRRPIPARCGSSSTGRSASDARRQRRHSTASARARGPTRRSAARCGSILQNIGGALPGEMDRATHGQPGKYTFCCAENEAANPWAAAARRARLSARREHRDGRRRRGHDRT